MSVPCVLLSFITVFSLALVPFAALNFDAVSALLLASQSLPSTLCLLGVAVLQVNPSPFEAGSWSLQPFLFNVKLNLKLSLVLQDTLRTILLLFCSTRFMHC